MSGNRPHEKNVQKEVNKSLDFRIKSAIILDKYQILMKETSKKISF
jgi:hypothetical protein